MYFNIIEAVYCDKFKIDLKFSNGKSGIVDLEKYVSDGEIFTDICFIDNFKKFSVEFGTLTWNNGEIDIAPETLYEKATGEKVIFEKIVKKVG